LRVLIVEDDPDQALLTCDALEASGYQPTVVDSVAQCRVENWNDFGLILVDYQLPDGFGLDLISDIRLASDIPIIMVTGEYGLAVEAIKRGASDYIVKTRDYLQTLALTIDKNVEQHKLRQEKDRLERDLQRTVLELQQKNEQIQFAQQQLIEAARLSAVAQLVSGVAHEINNPLTGIIGFSELMQSTATDESMRSMLGTINSLAMRCASIIKALATFARQGKNPKGPVGINDLLRSCLTLNEHTFTRNDIKVTLNLDGTIPVVYGHAGQLQQVFVNIIKNSQQALTEISRDRVLYVRTFQGPEDVSIEISDNGKGMDAAAQSHAFEPFFTTQQVGKGSGLGLSVTYGIVREHGGSITIDSKPEQGTKITITLPCNPELMTVTGQLNELSKVPSADLHVIT
jgi:two-component system NtrC family sensor kinase